MKKNKYDIVVIGGGFYGCCLALALRGQGYSVCLVEKEPDLMQRASAINQARVHTGFHYPRNLATAVRSLVNFPRFAFEFRKAIEDKFTMLYAIARQGSKVTAKRFFLMFKELNAPIRKASSSQAALFSSSRVEDVFAVDEYAFNHKIIKDILEKRLIAAGVEIALNTEVLRCAQTHGGLEVCLNNTHIEARHVFNCTYSRANFLLDHSEESPLAFKHEITEMVLVDPPEVLTGLAVTIMDGPFFSLMPFPAEQKYSFSHVRYTPHLSWLDSVPCQDPHKVLNEYHKCSNFVFMLKDAIRFMPDLELTADRSLFEVKTVLLKNEFDDGRPIFFGTHPNIDNLYTVLGSKIDNVYDLFASMKSITGQLDIQRHNWRSLLGISHDQ